MDQSNAPDDYFKQENRRAIESWRDKLDEQDNKLTTYQASALLLKLDSNPASHQLADADGHLSDLVDRLCMHLKEHVTNPETAYRNWKLPIGVIIRWARLNDIGCPELINEVLGPFPEAGGAPAAVLEQYCTNEARLMLAAIQKFWIPYDPQRPETIPKKDIVVEWLKEQGITSHYLAEATDSIIRDPATRYGDNRRRKV